MVSNTRRLQCLLNSNSISRKIHVACNKGGHKWREGKKKKHHRNAEMVVFIKQIISNQIESNLADLKQDGSKNIW